MMKELFEIQQRLKSNKDKFNDFAKFAYRNLEDILSDLKTLLKSMVVRLPSTMKSSM